MTCHNITMTAKVRSRLLIAVLVLVFACIPATVNAARLAESTTGDCQVLMDHTSRKGWTPATEITFAHCAQEVSRSGDYVNGKWAIGSWAGNDVSVNGSGEVYFKDHNDTQWQRWGKLAANQDTDADGILDANDKCPDEAEVINNFADNDGCPDSLEELLQLARKDINDFGKNVFDEHQWDYTPPSRFVPYTSRTAKRVFSGCGGVVPGNAMYCPQDHGIYFDLEFLNKLLFTYGDYTPVLVLAHERGHSIQRQIYGQYCHMSIKQELEADCLAGSYTRYAALGSQVLEQGDLKEGIANIYAFGDNLPWFALQAHGSPEQRTTAFLIGVGKGVDACWIP